ncbi:MAG: DUF3326 domain-containing protein, partial [Kamptonema sp. SIO4C4]|nr:DUF3326 domain-containing protein [Kamptonema sp. SIO4C4]
NPISGDALPVAKALARVCDRLITHPNVLNGAQLYWPLPNTAYVEGYGLDQFAAGHWGLQPVPQNRIGLLLDAGIEPELRLRHLQAAEATRATLGLNLTDYCLTDQPLGVELRTAPSGASWGTIRHPDSLLRAAEKLITQAKATAIAVVARFPDEPPENPELQNYRHGSGVDPIAGAEAVISHLIVRELGIPCAHAPALSPLPVDAEVSPRAAAEELGYTFLPCVLVGLSQAPQFVRPSQPRTPEQIWADQVDAVVVPASACGGSATLNLSQSCIIAVADNTTQMQAPPAALGIKALSVQSYLEAIGAIAAYRQGINPQLLKPKIAPLHCLP